MPAIRPPSALHPYRLFHLSARLRLRDRPSPPPSPPPFPHQDDYYALLLETPTPNPSRKTINPARAPKSSQPSSSNNLPPPSAASIQGSDHGPSNQVLFSAPLSGPSPRMRGLARAETGLERPPEPDNCCMSGCVNCVWDAYREEVEEWARVRRMRDRRFGRGVGDGDGGGVGIGEVDEVGGRTGFEGVDVSEEGIFEGVPVGIREFMNVEKRLREKRDKG